MNIDIKKVVLILVVNITCIILSFVIPVEKSITNPISHYLIVALAADLGSLIGCLIKIYTEKKGIN